MPKFVVFYFEEKQNKTLPKTFNRIIDARQLVAYARFPESFMSFASTIKLKK